MTLSNRSFGVFDPSGALDVEQPPPPPLGVDTRAASAFDPDGAEEPPPPDDAGCGGGCGTAGTTSPWGSTSVDEERASSVWPTEPEPARDEEWNPFGSTQVEGAQNYGLPLDSLVAPFLAPVVAAIEPLLQAHGLSTASSTVDDLIDVDGLVDEVVDAAVEVVLRIVGESSPSSSFAGGLPDVTAADDEDADDLASEWAGVSVRDSELPGWRTPLDPTGTGDAASGLPGGWTSPPARGSTPSMSFPREDDAPGGGPCCADLPGCTGYPPCETEDGTGHWWELDCLHDPGLTNSLQRLYAETSFSLLAAVDGVDYGDILGDGVVQPPDAEPILVSVHDDDGLYTCCDVKGMWASYYVPGQELEFPKRCTPPPNGGNLSDAPQGYIALGDNVLDPPLLEVLWSAPIGGGKKVRAAVLLHELIHRIDREAFGIGFFNEEVQVGKWKDCKRTEYRAGYEEARYLLAAPPNADCLSDAFGRATARTSQGCKRQYSKATRILADVGDFMKCFDWEELGWLIVSAALLLVFPGTVALALVGTTFNFAVAVLLVYIWVF